MRCITVMGIAILVSAGGNVFADLSVSFMASDVKAVMASDGAPLSNGNNQWGLWAVRAMPVVTGGNYTITSGFTSQTGWGVSAPNGAFGAAPYTASNSAWFWDASGAEAGYPANPLYMIMDRPANTFTSYFGNTVTAVGDSSTFTFSFALDPGATWTGDWQFVVDGSKYTVGSESSPGAWVADFFGGYGEYDGTWRPMGLAGDMGAGYVVPVPAALLLGVFGFGAAGVKLRRLA